MTTWIIIHVPKCGGLSLRRAIEQAGPAGGLNSFTDTHLQEPGFRHPAQDERDADFEARIRPLLDAARPGPRLTFVYGHFTVQRVRPWLGKPGIKVGTVIRDPVERLVSHYYWWQQWPDPGHPMCRKLHEQGWSILEFARQPAMHNAISYFLAGWPPERFDYIGLVTGTAEDYLLRVFGLLLSRTGLKTKQALDHLNRNPARTQGRYPLDDRIRAEIQAINDEDYRLYNRLVARHQALMKATPIAP